MKKIAYIITKESTSELIEESVFAPMAKGEHGGHVKGVFFVGDGVYYLLKGSRTAKNIKTIAENTETDIYACKSSVNNRKLQNILLNGVVVTTLSEFYEAMSDVDHIISF